MGALALLYGAVVYILFFAAFLYLIPFVGGDMLSFLGAPRTVDTGGPAGGPAALINIGLLLLFGLQHSVMARRTFKKVWTKIVPWSTERSTFVLATALVLYLLYTQWRPMPGIVWEVGPGAWHTLLMVLFFLGFGIVLIATFLIDHFELFGLMQVWYRFRGKAIPAPVFRTPMFYKLIRHPIYFGFIMAFWSTPTMTAGHLLFAAVWTAYIFIAIGYEERDLIRLFGQKYVDYMGRVPSILPFTMWGP
jgi:methanethiol S-methyltransferase